MRLYPWVTALLAAVMLNRVAASAASQDTTGVGAVRWLHRGVFDTSRSDELNTLLTSLTAGSGSPDFPLQS
jgi:hypothetical protein